MPYTEQLPHAGSAEVLFTGMFDEPAGTLARVWPRRVVNANAGALGATGIPVATALPLPAGLVISSLAVLSGNTAEVTGSHFWMAVMDPGSNVLAVTADQQGGTYVTANTFLKNPVTIPYQVPQTGLYYVVLCVSAATMPTMAAGPSNGVLSSGLNALAPVLTGTLGSQPAPPAAGANLGALTAASAMGFNAWIS